LRQYVNKLQPQLLLKTSESAGHISHIPTITICHDIDSLIADAQASKSGFFRHVLNLGKSYLRRRALRASDFVICNSQFVRRAVQEFYGIVGTRTAVAYCGVDPRFYQIAQRTDKHKVRERYGGRNFVLTFATGDTRENYRTLPAVMARLAEGRTAICLLIAGLRRGAAYVADLRDQCRRAGLREGVEFVLEDFFSADRFEAMAELYTSADFYLELSLHEGFGMQLAEAMACGTTCISSQMAALAEVGDRFVIPVNPIDSNAVAATIQAAYDSGLHLQDNREQVLYTRKFSWEETGKVVANTVSMFTGGHPPA
jgi:glycosyltransferase involved in cell wall biosynthesis